MQNTELNKNSQKKDRTEDFPIKKNSLICPACSHLTQLIPIHGHYQCINCKNIIYSCCEVYSE